MQRKEPRRKGARFPRIAPIPYRNGTKGGYGANQKPSLTQKADTGARYHANKVPNGGKKEGNNGKRKNK
jgi:hypothetical protein